MSSCSPTPNDGTSQTEVGEPGRDRAYSNPVVRTELVVAVAIVLVVNISVFEAQGPQGLPRPPWDWPRLTPTIVGEVANGPVTVSAANEMLLDRFDPVAHLDFLCSLLLQIQLSQATVRPQHRLHPLHRSEGRSIHSPAATEWCFQFDPSCEVNPIDPALSLF